MLSVQERLENIEAGLVEADNRFAKIHTWNNLDTILEEFRGRIKNLYNRIAAVRNVFKTSEEICKTAEAELEERT